MAGETVSMPLTPAARRLIDRDHAGRGGFQTLLRKMRTQITHDGAAVQMSAADVEKWIRYSTKYGEGGFENRLRSVKRGANATKKR